MSFETDRAEVISCTRCGRAVANGLICACCQSLLFQYNASDDSSYRRDLTNIKRFPEYDRLRR